MAHILHTTGASVWSRRGESATGSDANRALATGQRAVESGRSAHGRRAESVGSKAARVLHFWAVGRVDAIIPRKTNLQPSIPTYQDCSIKQIIPRKTNRPGQGGCLVVVTRSKRASVLYFLVSDYLRCGGGPLSVHTPPAFLGFLMWHREAKVPLERLLS